MLYAWIDKNGLICATDRRDLLPEDVDYVEFPDLDFIDAYKLTMIDGQIVLKSDSEVLQELKQQKIAEASQLVKEYILRYYPDEKQKSDLADREYFSAYLLMINQNYTFEEIYKTTSMLALQIYRGQITLDEAINQFPENEQKAWEQLIKIGLRVSFVQDVKIEYANFVNRIQNAKTVEEVENIQIAFKTKFPL